MKRNFANFGIDRPIKLGHCFSEKTQPTISKAVTSLHRRGILPTQLFFLWPSEFSSELTVWTNSSGWSNFSEQGWRSLHHTFVFCLIQAILEACPNAKQYSLRGSGDIEKVSVSTCNGHFLLVDSYSHLLHVKPIYTEVASLPEVCALHCIRKAPNLFFGKIKSAGYLASVADKENSADWDW